MEQIGAIARRKVLVVDPRTKYEYQPIGQQLDDHFGKEANLWWVFSKYDAGHVAEALAICKSAGVRYPGYLVGICQSKLRKKI